MADFANPSVYQLRTPGGIAQGVGIAPDNSTVIICDAARSRIYYGRVNAAYSGLLSESELPGDGGTYYGPLNVAISPDSKTVLTANSWSGYINVFQITSPGVLVPGATPKIGIHNAPQSIVFSPDGKNAYVLANGSASRDTVSWLRINGVGNVSLAAENAATLLSTSGTSFYGVHTLAMHPTQNFAVAGFSSPTSLTGLAYVNLTTFQVSQITTGQGDTAGVATFLDAIFPPANAALSRVENSFIFYKEYINRLSWQANPKNKIAISKYRIYVKRKTDPDTSYQLLKEVDGSVLGYDDRGLKRGDELTYRLTAVNINGLESPAVVVGN
jgi:DNA-binding beta-propeller fold protein YncE